MELIGFTGCCTAQVIAGFGQTVNGDWEFRPDEVLSTSQIKAGLGILLNRARRSGQAVVTVTTNDKQVNANKALNEVGFESSIWMSKTQHPETRLRLWWFPLNHKDING
jgi:hypothetical protein